jgi:heptosyltransferase-2
VVRARLRAHARHRQDHRQPAAHGEFAWQRRRALGVALRAARYTHAYVLPNTWKSALVPWFAQVPRRIGYRGEARYRLLTDARRLDRHGLPQLVARYAALAVPRGEPAPAPAPPTLVPNAANLAQAMRALDLSRAQPIAILCPARSSGRPSAGPPSTSPT